MDPTMYRRLDALESWKDSQASYEKTVYAEGTYTPTYYGGTTAGVTTYTTQSGIWVRVGRLITVWATVVWTAATGTGQARISLPFAPRSTPAQRYAGVVRPSEVTYGGDWVVAVTSNTADYVVIQTATSGAAATNIAVEAAGTIDISITYPIA